MNADIERLKMLLTETIALLCQRGLTYQRELRVQGLLGVTVDGTVFLIPVDERTFTNNKQPSCVSREMEVGADCGSNSLSQQHGSPAHRVANTEVLHHLSESEVQHAKNDATTVQPLSTQCPIMDDNPCFRTMPKMEIVDIDEGDSDTENQVQMAHSRSSEYFSASEPVSRTPFQSPHTFPTATYGFENMATAVQAQMPCGDLKYEGKRKRKRSTFGDDMLVLSPDNDEWTNNSQREVAEPVAGCSQWPEFGNEFQCDVAWDDSNSGSQSHMAIKSMASRRRARDCDGKNFLCQYENCNKAFFRKDHLVRHQRQKHGKPFGVDSQLIYYCYNGDCDKTFYKVASLNRHMIMVHNYAMTEQPLE